MSHASPAIFSAQVPIHPSSGVIRPSAMRDRVADVGVLSAETKSPADRAGQGASVVVVVGRERGAEALHAGNAIDGTTLTQGRSAPTTISKRPNLDSVVGPWTAENRSMTAAGRDVGLPLRGVQKAKGDVTFRFYQEPGRTPERKEKSP